MDIETLASKLGPLAPADVVRWMRIRESADPETARLVEEQIRATARRLLGDTDNQILLSLPPARLISGPIRLGMVEYAGDRGQAGLSTGDLIQNLGVYGRSGAGKTNAVFHILMQLADQGVPFLFLDWKRTARHWIPHLKAHPNIYTAGRPLSPLVFNPFTPPPALEPSTYIGLLVDVLADAYDLGDGAISILQAAIHACYTSGNLAPTAGQILERIRGAPHKGRALGWTASATRALQSIEFAGIASTGEGRGGSQSELVQRLLHESTIIELDGLTAASRRFLVPMLCLWLYYQRLASEHRETLSLVLVLEEAHHLLPREKQRASEPVLLMLLRLYREIGIGTVVVAQHPHLIPSAALGNAAVTLVMNLKDPADLSKAAGLCAVSDSDKRCFTMLPVGHAVVKLQDRWRRPFLIRMPLVPVDKGRVTDAELRRFLASGPGQRARSAGSRAPVPGSGDMGRVRPSAEPLDGEALRVLEDVMEHPDDGVRERYRRLGLSGDRGNGLKRALLKGGWVEQQLVRMGNTRKALLRPTPAASGLLGPNRSATGDGSIAHAYWQRVYTRMLAEVGYQVQMEAPRSGGRVDLLARKGDELVGVEIETGRSIPAENVRACLRSGFTRVLVVATDPPALAIVERRLAAAGLLVPGRVAVVCAPDAPPWFGAPTG